VAAGASMEAAGEVAVSTPVAVPEGEDSTQAAASEEEDSVPDLHRHRGSGVGAIRARCLARLRGSRQDHRQDLAATFTVRIVAPVAEANGPRFRRRLTLRQTDSGIPLAVRRQHADLRGPHLGHEVQPARAGRHLAGIGRPVKPTR
jgi:hypothetical protein